MMAQATMYALKKQEHENELEEVQTGLASLFPQGKRDILSKEHLIAQRNQLTTLHKQVQLAKDDTRRIFGEMQSLEDADTEDDSFQMQVLTQNFEASRKKTSELKAQTSELCCVCRASLQPTADHIPPLHHS